MQAQSRIIHIETTVKVDDRWRANHVSLGAHQCDMISDWIEYVAQAECWMLKYVSIATNKYYVVIPEICQRNTKHRVILSKARKIIDYFIAGGWEIHTASYKLMETSMRTSTVATAAAAAAGLSAKIYATEAQKSKDKQKLTEGHVQTALSEAAAAKSETAAAKSEAAAAKSQTAITITQLVTSQSEQKHAEDTTLVAQAELQAAKRYTKTAEATAKQASGEIQQAEDAAKQAKEQYDKLAMAIDGIQNERNAQKNAATSTIDELVRFNSEKTHAQNTTLAVQAELYMAQKYTKTVEATAKQASEERQQAEDASKQALSERKTINDKYDKLDVAYDKLVQAYGILKQQAETSTQP